MFGYIRSHKTILSKILCVLLAVILGVLSAALVTKNASQIWNELSNYSYFDTSSSVSVAQSQPEVSSETEVIESTPPAPPSPTVINAYMPYKKQSLAAGSSFGVIVSARPDSTTVTATFNGQTIPLIMQGTETQPDGTASEFVDFTGTFTLPTGNENDINLGGVTFYAEWQGYAKKYTSPSIICLRDSALDRVTVVEIVAESAETFDGSTTDDNSDPRLSYLPKGTIDYKVGNTVYDAKSGNSYYKLRCGRKVYINKKNPPDASRMTVSVAYAGEVPDKNEISLASNVVSGGHTYLTFDTAWKAPFMLDLAPQHYNNPASRDFTIQNATYSYVDIKFCYTQSIGGDMTMPADNPLFSSAQIIAADGGYILRLHLKRVGGFYGWDCYYNNSGQLVFKFLNPKKATAASNEYGISLADVNILIDAGHGGKDIGAEGLMPDLMTEAERNLVLAYKLKSELEKMGANVTMTRYDDTALTAEGRCSALRKASPDLCVSIHHDSSESQKPNGCGVFCFNAFSHNATQSVYNRTKSAGIYANVYKKWHYFYLARVTSCPVVLIENGFITSPLDFVGISDDNINSQKAKAMAQGIAEYFNSYQ